MIWFTLREHRAQLVAMAITAALLAIGLVVMGNYAAAQRAALGVDSCVPLPNTNVNCANLDFEWRQRLGPGPYLVLPFLGPSSVRDATGSVVDWATDPVVLL